MHKFEKTIHFIQYSNFTELGELDSLYQEFKDDPCEARCSEIETQCNMPVGYFKDIVRFYNVLMKSELAWYVIGVKKHLDPGYKDQAAILYTVNTKGFMLDFNKDDPDPKFTDEQIENAIDDEFDPLGPFNKQRKN